jgi:transketolase
VALYDDNGISIDGPVDGWFRDDTPARFRRLWLARHRPHRRPRRGGVDARSPQARQASTDKPTLIVCRTTIGQGSPARAGTAKAHGEPLGADEIAATRAAIGWPHAPFEMPPEVRAVGRQRSRRAAPSAWAARLAAYRAAFPARPPSSSAAWRGELPATLRRTCRPLIAGFGDKPEAVATRKASQKVLAVLARGCPSCWAAVPT